MLRMADLVFEYVRYNPFYAKPAGNKVWWLPLESMTLWKLAMYVSLELPLVMLMNYHRLKGEDRKFQRFQKLKNFQERTL